MITRRGFVQKGILQVAGAWILCGWAAGCGGSNEAVTADGKYAQKFEGPQAPDSVPAKNETKPDEEGIRARRAKRNADAK